MASYLSYVRSSRAAAGLLLVVAFVSSVAIGWGFSGAGLKRDSKTEYTIMKASNAKVAPASGLAGGLVIGIAIGSSFTDLAVGVSLGLLLGSAAASCFEYQSGRRGIGWTAISVGAFVWVLGITLFVRT